MTHWCYHFHSAAVTGQEDNMHQACTQYTTESCASRSPANKQGAVTHGADIQKGQMNPPHQFPVHSKWQTPCYPAPQSTRSCSQQRQRQRLLTISFLQPCFLPGQHLGRGGLLHLFGWEIPTGDGCWCKHLEKIFLLLGQVRCRFGMAFWYILAHGCCPQTQRNLCFLISSTRLGEEALMSRKQW